MIPTQTNLHLKLMAPQRQTTTLPLLRLRSLRQTLNPSVDNVSAVEMLAQHILTAKTFTVGNGTGKQTSKKRRNNEKN